MTDASANPLLALSTLPYGLPDYREIEPQHYLPAFEVAFAEHRREIDAITRARSMPTFENTLVALESSGGRYRSLQLEVTVRDEAHRLGLFAALSKHPDVRFVL